MVKNRVKKRVKVRDFGVRVRVKDYNLINVRTRIFVK